MTVGSTVSAQHDSWWFSRLPRWGKASAIRVFPIWLKTRSLVWDRWQVRSYSCRALTGQSNYNICINADLTVSCNCQDFDGSGHIGNLKTQTLEAVFSGSTVSGFLEALRAGKLPTTSCQHCDELLVLSDDSDRTPAPAGAVPRLGIMLENTALCNLHCALCDERRPMLLASRSSRSLSPEDVELVSNLLHQYGIESLYYFNLNEPFVSRNILEEIRTIRTSNPGIRIVTSTNGLLLNTPEKLEAALLMDYVYVSLDGIDQETVTKYQVGGDFERSFENMRRLCEARVRRDEGVRLPIVEWKYVMFRWNDSPSHVAKAVDLAKSVGVDLLGFAPGGAPQHDMSVRYYLDEVIWSVGEVTRDGVVINFAGVPADLVEP